jgi:hypothetical protein
VSPPKRVGPDADNAEAQPIPNPNRTSEFNSDDRQVWAYECAASHLLAVDLTPAPNVPALRVMWKAGPESRRMAGLIAERWELI